MSWYDQPSHRQVGSNRPQPRESIEAIADLQEALCRSSESENFGDFRIGLYSELTNYNTNDVRQMKMVVTRDNPLYTNIYALTRNKKSDGPNSSIWQCNTVHVNDDFSKNLTDCIFQVTFDPLPRDVTKEVASYPFDLNSIDKNLSSSVMMNAERCTDMLLPKETRESSSGHDILNVRVPVEPYWNRGFSAGHGKTKGIPPVSEEDVGLNLTEPTHESVMRLKWSRMIIDQPTASELTLNTSRISSNEEVGNPAVQDVQAERTQAIYDSDGWTLVDEEWRE